MTAAPAPGLNANTFKIVLTFDTADEALRALEHIGDTEAPVFLGDEATASEDFSRVEIGEAVFTLWEGYDDAVKELLRQASA